MSLENLRNRATSSTPETPTMKNRIISPMKLTLGELKEVVDANPNHPKSKGLLEIYEKYIGKLSPESAIAVDRNTVLGIIDNLEVLETSTSTGGREGIRTTTGKKLAASPAKSADAKTEVK